MVGRKHPTLSDHGCGPVPGHSRVTHSRNRAVPGGHARTAGRRHMSSGGLFRSRRDPRGHAADTVRDREDEGSNPSPPTILVFKIGDFGGCLPSAGHRRVTISLRSNQTEGRKSCLSWGNVRSGDRNQWLGASHIGGRTGQDGEAPLTLQETQGGSISALTRVAA
jgi:hypothetical protein